MEISEKYNKLTCISYHSKDKWGAKLFVFQCDCGIEKVIKGAFVKRGKTKSCGCLKESDEYRQKISKTLTGRFKGKNHPMFGKHLTKEQRKKLSIAISGRKHSNETKHKISESLQGKKHTEETKKKISEAHKGKPLSKETRKKISKTLTGKLVGKNHPNYGKSMSEEQRKKISQTLVGRNAGEKNPAWKGGVNPLHDNIRKLLKRQEWHNQIFERDDFTCQSCGKRGGYLHAHHIEPVNELVERFGIKRAEEILEHEIFFDLDNGITYCKECHELLGNKGGLLQEERVA